MKTYTSATIVRCYASEVYMKIKNSYICDPRSYITLLYRSRHFREARVLLKEKL